MIWAGKGCQEVVRRCATEIDYPTIVLTTMFDDTITNGHQDTDRAQLLTHSLIKWPDAEQRKASLTLDRTIKRMETVQNEFGMFTRIHSSTTSQ